jgi:hypothetical protein
LKRRAGLLGPAGPALAAAAALAPFAGKAYHVDDTVFLRIARQIQERPLAPYDFRYNWGLTPVPAWVLNLHPPLNGYYLAAVGLLAREREVWTHLAYLPFAAACAALMTLIARRLCRRPLPAVLASLACPAFFVSATNVMADVPLLMFWLLAALLTLESVEPGKESRLWAAAAAAAAAAMTKYFGLSLVPLGLAYWLAKKRRASIHLASFLVAPAAVALWGWYSETQIGFFHPFASGEFGWASARLGPPTAVAAAAFLGGGSAWALALAPTMRRLGRFALPAVAAAAAAALLMGGVPAAARVEWLALSFGGGLLFSAAAAGAAARPDAESLFLSLWFGGVLLFAGLLNWTVNERALLPAFFPAAVLVTRWLESSADGERRLSRWPWAVAPAFALSLLLAAADAGHAGAARDFAAGPARALIRGGRRARFIGHWGFQYYMEREGAEPFDYRRPELGPDERLCVSLNNSSTLPVPEPLRSRLVVEAREAAPDPLGVRLTDVEDGTAGFYSSDFGPVPFSFARGAAYDEFLIQRADAPGGPTSRP